LIRGFQVLTGEKLEKKSQTGGPKDNFESFPQVLKGFLLMYQNDVPIL
jgi:hypothetical protein